MPFDPINMTADELANFVVVEKVPGVLGPETREVMRVQGADPKKESRYQKIMKSKEFVPTTPTICRDPENPSQHAYFVGVEPQRKRAAEPLKQQDPSVRTRSATCTSWEVAVGERCMQHAHVPSTKLAELAETVLTSADTPEVVKEADRTRPVGGRGWAGKFQPKYRSFSKGTLTTLRQLFIASKISAEDAAKEVHLSDPENPLVVYHVVEHRVKNFFGKLSAAKKAHIDLTSVTDATELEGRMVNSVAELKAECASHGLKNTGKKSDLCARLDRHELGQTTPTDLSAAGKLGTHGSKMVHELNAEISARNAGRSPGRLIVPTSSRKGDLAAALQEDDEDDPEYIEEDEARQSSLLTRDPLEIEGDDPLSDADE